MYYEISDQAMNLIVDIGNTRVKYALMTGGECRMVRSSDDFELPLVRQMLFESGEPVQRAIVSSTRANEATVADALRLSGLDVLCFAANCRVPLANHYLTPETLGRDRLAAAVGADALYPGRAMLIVDFGTAITCDLVVGHTFCGGFISPGMQLRFRALHDYTARLPLVKAPSEFLEVGRTTEEAIAQGVEQGIVGEIEGYIARFGEKFEDLLVIFTGGDAKHFVKRIKNTIFADCDLVLLGLNRILAYYVQTEK